MYWGHVRRVGQVRFISLTYFIRVIFYILKQSTLCMCPLIDYAELSTPDQLQNIKIIQVCQVRQAGKVFLPPASPS